MTPEWKAEVTTLDLLNRMVTDPLPLGLSAGPVEPFFQRDMYFDSADWTLRRRGVSCRFRIRVDDRRILTLRTIGRWEGGVPLVLPQTFEADVPELEGAQALVARPIRLDGCAPSSTPPCYCPVSSSKLSDACGAPKPVGSHGVATTSCTTS